MTYSLFHKMAGRCQKSTSWRRVRNSRFSRATSTMPVGHSDESRDLSCMYGVRRGGFPRGGGGGHCYGGQRGRGQGRGNRW